MPLAGVAPSRRASASHSDLPILLYTNHPLIGNKYTACGLGWGSGIGVGPAPRPSTLAFGAGGVSLTRSSLRSLPSGSLSDE